MNLKRKLSRFFTLSRKANGGFTLVELIVVIAILAILGGIAVPAYNGYIKKADRAADEALLNEINKAFVSACMENGKSNLGPWKKIRLDIDGESNVNRDALETDSSDVNTSFEKFFEGGAFKLFKRLRYREGEFVGEEIVQFKWGDKDYSCYSLDIDAYGTSNFSDITVPETLELMDTLVATVISATYIDPDTGETKGALASLKGDPAFTQYLLNNGLDPEINDQAATGLAFYTAEKMASIDPYAVAAAMTGNASADIENMYKIISGKDDPNAATYSEKAVSAAVMYALTASYAKSDFAPDGTELPTGEDAIASTVQLAGYLGDYYQQDGFKQYLASSTAVADVEGLIGVLRTLDTNDENALGIFEETGDYTFNQLDYEDLIYEFLKQGS